MEPKSIGQVKTIFISVLCLLALIAQVAATDSDPGAALSTMIEANQVEALNAINNCRRKMNPTANNMAKVRWSTEAAESAFDYAKECPLMEHSDPSQKKLFCSAGCNCVENVFFASYPASWTEAIAEFCNECKYFVNGVGAQPEGPATGHYSKTVWNKSFSVGCDAFYCPHEDVFKFIYVCHHCPPGNSQGSINRPDEAGPTCGKCPNACTNLCPYEDKFSNCADLLKFCGDPKFQNACKRTCNCKSEIV